MACADRAVGPKGQQCASRNAVDNSVRKRQHGKKADENDNSDRTDVPESDREGRPKNGARSMLLQSEGNRKEPSHAGIDSVKAAEKKKSGPDETHIFTRAWSLRMALLASSTQTLLEVNFWMRPKKASEIAEHRFVGSSSFGTENV